MDRGVVRPKDCLELRIFKLFLLNSKAALILAKHLNGERQGPLEQNFFRVFPEHRRDRWSCSLSTDCSSSTVLLENRGGKFMSGVFVWSVS